MTSSAVQTVVCSTTISYLMYFHDFFSTFFQLHNQAGTEEQKKIWIFFLSFCLPFWIFHATLWLFLGTFEYFSLGYILWIDVLPHVLSRFFFKSFPALQIRRRQRNMSSPKQNKIWNWVPKIRSWHNLSNNCIKVSLQLIR